MEQSVASLYYQQYSLAGALGSAFSRHLPWRETQAEACGNKNLSDRHSCLVWWQGEHNTLASLEIADNELEWGDKGKSKSEGFLWRWWCGPATIETQVGEQAHQDSEEKPAEQCALEQEGPPARRETQFPTHRMNHQLSVSVYAHSIVTINCVSVRARSSHHPLFLCVHTTQPPSDVSVCAHSTTLHSLPGGEGLSVQLCPLDRTQSLFYLWSLDVVSVSSIFLYSVTVFFLLNLILTTRVQCKNQRRLILLLLYTSPPLCIFC